MNTENIEKLVRNAVTCKKPSKKIVQATIKMLADKYPDEIYDLAPLYTYFMPTRIKKATNPFEWVSLAMGKKDVRYYLNYVYVEESRIIATDGHRLHIYPNIDKLKPGFYLQNGDFYEDQRFARYPDINAILPESLQYQQFNKSDLQITDYKNILAYKFDHNGEQIKFQKEYIDQAINGTDCVEIAFYARSSLAHISIQYDDKRAIIASLR